MTAGKTPPATVESVPPVDALPRSRNASGRALIQNALSSYVTLFLGAIIGFVSTPLFLRALGTVRFGTLALLAAAAGYLSLLEVGLGTAATTRVASVEHEGPEALQELVSTTMLMFAVVGVAAMLLTGLFSLFLPLAFSIPRALRGDATIAFLFIGSAQAVNSMVTAFSSFLIGTGRMSQMTLTGFAISTAGSLISLAIVLTDPSLPLLGAITLLTSVVSLLAMRYLMRRSLAGAKPRLRDARAAIMRRLLALGWRNAISSVAGILAFGSDLVLIGFLLTPLAAASYAVALRGNAFLVRFTHSVTGTIGPAHSHRAATADSEHRFELLRISLLLTLMLAIFCGVTVAAFAHGLLHLWLGRVPAHCSTILIVFCAILILQSPGVAGTVMMTSSERAAEVMWLTLGSAAINVVASIVLTLQLGVIGPALGSLAAVVLFDTFVMPRRACRGLGISYTRLLTESVRPLVVPACALAAVLLAGRQIATEGPIILLLAAMATVVYAAALWGTPSVRALSVGARKG